MEFYKFGTVVQPDQVLQVGFGDITDIDKKYAVYRLRMFQCGLSPLNFVEFVNRSEKLSNNSHRATSNPSSSSNEK